MQACGSDIRYGFPVTCHRLRGSASPVVRVTSHFSGKPVIFFSNHLCDFLLFSMCKGNSVLLVCFGGD